MKKITPVFFLLLWASLAWSADIKVTEMTEDTAPSTTDIVMTVKDPSGTPLSQKVTIGHLLDAGFTAAGDIIVGSGSKVSTVISKGSDNTVFCVNGSSQIGWCSSFSGMSIGGFTAHAGMVPLADASGFLVNSYVSLLGPTALRDFTLPDIDANIAVKQTNTTLGTSSGRGFSIAGTSLSAGSVYYMGASALAVAKADSTSTLPGICIADSTTSCLYSGVYRYSASQSWTVGGVIYVSAATGGALTQTAPSTPNKVQKVGVALAADTILIMPSLDWVTGS